MPTLSEMNEHAADAEHQAFQRAYDALLDIAKDPITCRHFWDAGFTAGQADANDMLTVAHMDGYSKGREVMQQALDALVDLWNDHLDEYDDQTDRAIQALRNELAKHSALPDGQNNKGEC